MERTPEQAAKVAAWLNMLDHCEAQLQGLAAEAGFIHAATTDLTPWLQLGRPRDVLVDLLLPLVAWLPLAHTGLGHLDGGRALQRGLKRGWLGYDLTLFRREG